MRKSVAGLALLLLAVAGTLACGSSSSSSSSSSQSAGAGSFTVSGAIEAATGSAADGDVNEPSSPFSPNDTLASAQEIPNPVSVGGYVNQPGTGPPGRSRSIGDTIDLFRADLAEGQVIRLFLAEAGADLDLALLTTSGTPLLRSDTTALVEMLTVPSSGEFVIEVSAFSGASNYVLTLGQDTSTAAASPGGEFVPGELIVRFRDAPADGRSMAATAQSRAAAMRLEVVATGSRGEVLMACRDAERVGEAMGALGIAHLEPAVADLHGEDRLRAATHRLAKAMRRRPDVEAADPNFIRHPTATPTDEFYPFQWHYPMIGLPQAWDNVTGLSGVVVGVIDTGVIPGHPDLQGQLVGGYDFVSSIASSSDGDGCDPDPTDPGDGVSGGASSWHGTHVTGTVAARTSLQPGGDSDGVAGVAWNARAMPLRALGRGGGTDFDLIQALRYAARLSNNCNALPAARVDVVNMSLGSPDPSGSLELALREVRNEGVVLVAAAGNLSSSAPFYPASYDEVISVSAVDSSKRLAPYSNFGDDVDVAAPGGSLFMDLGGDGVADGVLSTLYDPASSGTPYVYAVSEGTSMAAPHVAGVIALMLDVNPNLTPDDIDRLLGQGRMTEDIGSSFLFGNGLVDAFASVEAAFEEAGGSPPFAAPRLSVSPPALNFGALTTAADVQVSNAGGDDGPLVVGTPVVDTTDGANWLSVSAENVDGSGLGRYRVSVDRGMVTPGIYSGSVLFPSNENDVEIAVLMQVGAFAAGSANAGRHFVLLLDADSLETVRSVAVNPSGGLYLYRFDDVEPGDYLIVAGTDFDNDLVICDAGEACGAYTTLDQPQRVDLDRNSTGMDFGTGFGLSFSSSSGGPGGGFSRAVTRRLFDF